MKAFLKLIFLICSLFFSLCAEGQKDTTKYNYNILVYGYPKSNSYINARNVIAKKWNIEYNRIANCSVSQHIFDSIIVHNDSVSARISNAYGTDWEQKYSNEIEQEIEKQRHITDLIKKQRFKLELDSTLTTNGNEFLDYIIEGTENENIYKVTVYGYGNWKGDTKIVSYFKLKINLKKDHVEIESSELELLFPD